MRNIILELYATGVDAIHLSTHWLKATQGAHTEADDARELKHMGLLYRKHWHTTTLGAHAEAGAAREFEHIGLLYRKHLSTHWHDKAQGAHADAGAAREFDERVPGHLPQFP